MMNNIKEINEKLLSSSYEEVLKSSSDYDTFLLLSPLRSNCLSVIDFSKDDDVLLIGGNGVIVNYLLGKVKHINILESEVEVQENIKIIAKHKEKYSFCKDILSKSYSKILIFGDYLPMLKEGLEE